MHHLPPASAVAGAAQPTPPECHGGAELVGDVGLGVWNGHLARFDAVEHESGCLPGPDGKMRTHILTVDPLQRAARRQAQPERRRAEQRAVLGELDLVACAGVVEARGDVDDEAHVNACLLYTSDAADE